MQVGGIGRVIVWSGGSLWIGRALARSEWHAHHAIQLCLGLSGQVRFCGEPDRQWSAYGGAFIPSDLGHEFDAVGTVVAHLFCEPESALGRSLLTRFGRERIVAVPSMEIEEPARRLGMAFDEGAPDEDLEAMALDLLHGLAGSVPSKAVDSRIARATLFIGQHLAEPLELEDVARHVGLSPSRFRHLFVAETGISFRAYVLWTRLQRALQLGFGGASWTDAAHATNFADSAHLSRTMHRMYGYAPTAIRQEIPAAARPLTA